LKLLEVALIQLHKIQHLRAIAAILVLLCHVTVSMKQNLNYEYVYSIFKFGYMGVDLFFILSGFIICYVHYSDFGMKEKLRPFIMRRFLRIYPVYWIVLLPVITFNFLFPSYGDGFERDVSEIIQSLLLIPQDHHPILRVAWTLRHEMFFYLIFGMVLIFNRVRLLSLIVISTWSALSFCSLFIDSPENWFWFYFVLSPHNLEFILGCSIAIIHKKRIVSAKMAWNTAWWGCGLLLMSWINEYTGYVKVPEVIAWGIPSSLLVFGVSALDIAGKTQYRRKLNYIGDASYSIYLTHLPAIHLFLVIFKALHVLDLLGVFITATLCGALSLLSGCLFYKIIEKPILVFSKRLFKKQPLFKSIDSSLQKL
jgi:peptidoglycan/LPS O-acetylase OafA/YrhL